MYGGTFRTKCAKGTTVHFATFCSHYLCPLPIIIAEAWTSFVTAQPLPSMEMSKFIHLIMSFII